MGCDLQNMRQERLFILGLAVADIPLQLVAGPTETLAVPKQVSNPRVFSIHSARGVVLSAQSAWRGHNRFKFLESQAERKMPLMGLVFIGVVNLLRRAHTTTLSHPAMLTNGTPTRSRVGALFAPGPFFFMLALCHYSPTRYLLGPISNFACPWGMDTENTQLVSLWSRPFHLKFCRLRTRLVVPYPILRVLKSQPQRRRNLRDQRKEVLWQSDGFKKEGSK
jgi:hypothetical protein